MMEFNELAKNCRALAYEGKDFEAIMQLVPIKKLLPAEQKKLRSLIDDFIVQYELAEQVRGKYRTQMFISGFAILFGLFILFFGYLRNEFTFSLGIGAAVILAGLKFLMEGYNQYKAPIDVQQVIPKKDSKFRRY